MQLFGTYDNKGTIAIVCKNLEFKNEIIYTKTIYFLIYDVKSWINISNYLKKNNHKYLKNVTLTERTDKVL